MRIKKELILRCVAGDTILIPVGQAAMEHNGLFLLNPVSARIWQGIEEGLTQQQILQNLLDEFDAAQEQIRADLEEFLTRLEQLDILER